MSHDSDVAAASGDGADGESATDLTAPSGGACRGPWLCPAELAAVTLNSVFGTLARGVDARILGATMLSLTASCNELAASCALNGADVWVAGGLLAHASEVSGAWRGLELDFVAPRRAVASIWLVSSGPFGASDVPSSKFFGALGNKTGTDWFFTSPRPVGSCRGLDDGANKAAGDKAWGGFPGSFRGLSEESGLSQSSAGGSATPPSTFASSAAG